MLIDEGGVLIEFKEIGRVIVVAKTVIHLIFIVLKLLTIKPRQLAQPAPSPAPVMREVRDPPSRERVGERENTLALFVLSLLLPEDAFYKALSPTLSRENKLFTNLFLGAGEGADCAA